MQELVTTDLILSTLKEWVEQKRVLDPHTWVETVLKLNVLISDEHDKLFALQQQVAEKKVQLIENAQYTVARANVKVQSLDIYRHMKMQEAKIGQIEEMIKIAKVQARLKDSEYRNQ